MNVLVACEESQRVCAAFRAKGHNAFSCDTMTCSGGHPEWHIHGDVLKILNPHPIQVAKNDIRMGIEFYTNYGQTIHTIWGGWDMIIAFPPCTHLCSAGQHWFSRGLKDPQLREDAVKFFMEFVNADCPRIAIENPVGIMSTRYRKPDCKTQPWHHGHPETKTTCLWLKGLPPLEPTHILEKPEGGWRNQHFTNGRYSSFVNYDENGKVMRWNDPRTAIIRSKTYPGIAAAMADQWG